MSDREKQSGLFARIPKVVAWWVTVGLFAAWLGWRGVLTSAQGGSWVGVLIGILLGVAILAGYTGRSDARLRTLRAGHPQAYVQTVCLYAESIPQYEALAEASGGHAKGLRSWTYLTVVVNSRSLQVYGGAFFGLGGRPKLKVSIPLPPAVEASVEVVPQGTWNLAALHVVAQFDSGPLAIDVLPGASRAGILLTLFRRKELGSQLEQLRAALRPVERG